MQTTITAQVQSLRPVGTFEGPNYSGTLATDADGMFWVYGTNAAGHDFLFPVSDHYAACHCTSIGTAPEIRGAA